MPSINHEETRFLDRITRFINWEASETADSLMRIPRQEVKRLKTTDDQQSNLKRQLADLTEQRYNLEFLIAYRDRLREYNSLVSLLDDAQDEEQIPVVGTIDKQLSASLTRIQIQLNLLKIQRQLDIDAINFDDRVTILEREYHHEKSHLEKLLKATGQKRFIRLIRFM